MWGILFCGPQGAALGPGRDPQRTDSGRLSNSQSHPNLEGSTCHWSHASKSWSCALGGRCLYAAVGAMTFVSCLVPLLVKTLTPWSVELAHGPVWTTAPYLPGLSSWSRDGHVT